MKCFLCIIVVFVAIFADVSAVRDSNNDLELGYFHLVHRRRTKETKVSMGMKAGKDKANKKKTPKKARTNFNDYFFMEMSMSLPSPSSPTEPTFAGDEVSDPPSIMPTISPSVSHSPSGPTSISDDESQSPAGPASLSDDTSPSTSPAPSLTPSPTVFVTAEPSLTPSSNPTPTTFQEDVIFRCTDGGIELAEPPIVAATIVNFQVGYLVESNTTLENYEEELEKQILASALVGALQCGRGGSLFGSDAISTLALVSMNTTTTESLCFPQVSLLNDCAVLETTFTVILAEDTDPEVASFLGYVALQQDMDGTVFVQALSGVDRVEYLSPLPLLPPLTTADGKNQTGEVSPSEGAISVTPWTVGAVLAMCIGGMIALWVWTRNRQTRNRRHMHLLEESSLVSPDPTSQA